MDTVYVIRTLKPGVFALSPSRDDSRDDSRLSELLETKRSFLKVPPIGMVFLSIAPRGRKLGTLEVLLTRNLRIVSRVLRSYEYCSLKGLSAASNRGIVHYQMLYVETQL